VEYEAEAVHPEVEGQRLPRLLLHEARGFAIEQRDEGEWPEGVTERNERPRFGSHGNARGRALLRRPVAWRRRGGLTVRAGRNLAVQFALDARCGVDLLR